MQPTRRVSLLAFLARRLILAGLALSERRACPGPPAAPHLLGRSLLAAPRDVRLSAGRSLEQRQIRPQVPIRVRLVVKNVGSRSMSCHPDCSPKD